MHNGGDGVGRVGNKCDKIMVLNMIISMRVMVLPMMIMVIIRCGGDDNGGVGNVEYDWCDCISVVDGGNNGGSDCNYGIGGDSGGNNVDIECSVFPCVTDDNVYVINCNSDDGDNKYYGGGNGGVGDKYDNYGDTEYGDNGGG